MYVVTQLYHYYISSESCDRFSAPDVSPNVISKVFFSIMIKWILKLTQYRLDDIVSSITNAHVFILLSHLFKILDFYCCPVIESDFQFVPVHNTLEGNYSIFDDVTVWNWWTANPPASIIPVPSNFVDLSLSLHFSIDTSARPIESQGARTSVSGNSLLSHSRNNKAADCNGEERDYLALSASSSTLSHPLSRQSRV